jgi:hypothetical protein
VRSQTKHSLSPEELDALVGCRLEAELTDGWFNTAYRVVLDDGRAAVVKLAPPADVPVLRYERGIMATEAMVYRRIAALPDVPAPAMVDALLDDAERWQSDLGATPEEIRTLVVQGGYVLDEVTRPALIHFDLWPGNIFVDGSRIAGLIDHERAFWGDPAAVASSPTTSPGYGRSSFTTSRNADHAWADTGRCVVGALLSRTPMPRPTSTQSLESSL